MVIFKLLFGFWVELVGVVDMLLFLGWSCMLGFLLDGIGIVLCWEGFDLKLFLWGFMVDCWWKFLVLDIIVIVKLLFFWFFMLIWLWGIFGCGIVFVFGIFFVILDIIFGMLLVLVLEIFLVNWVIWIFWEGIFGMLLVRCLELSFGKWVIWFFGVMLDGLVYDVDVVVLIFVMLLFDIVCVLWINWVVDIFCVFGKFLCWGLVDVLVVVLFLDCFKLVLCYFWVWENILLVFLILGGVVIVLDFMVVKEFFVKNMK